MAQGLVADALGYVWDKLLTAALTAVFTASFLGLTLRGALFTRPGRLLFKCCVGFKYTILVFMVDDKANEGVFRKVTGVIQHVCGAPPRMRPPSACLAAGHGLTPGMGQHGQSWALLRRS